MVKSVSAPWEDRCLLAVDAGSLSSGILDILTNQLLAKHYKRFKSVESGSTGDKKATIRSDNDKNTGNNDMKESEHDNIDKDDELTKEKEELLELYSNLFATRKPTSFDQVFPQIALPYARPVDNTWHIVNRLLATICVTHPHMDHVAGLVLSSSNFSLPGECEPGCLERHQAQPEQQSGQHQVQLVLNKEWQMGSGKETATENHKKIIIDVDPRKKDDNMHMNNDSAKGDQIFINIEDADKAGTEDNNDRKSTTKKDQLFECTHCQPSLPKTVAGLKHTVDALKNYVFNGIIWPNLTNEGIEPVNLFTLKRLKAINIESTKNQNTNSHSISSIYSNLNPNSNSKNANTNTNFEAVSEENTHLLATNLLVQAFQVSHGNVCLPTAIAIASHRRSSVARFSMSNRRSNQRAASVFLPSTTNWTFRGFSSPTQRNIQSSGRGSSGNGNGNGSEDMTFSTPNTQPPSPILAPYSSSLALPSFQPPSPSTTNYQSHHQQPPSIPSSSFPSAPSSISATTTAQNNSYTSTAYFIRDTATERELLIWGDVEPDSVSKTPRNRSVWTKAAQLHAHNKLAAIFIECSFPCDSGPLFGHMAPDYLVNELVVLQGLAQEVRDRDLDNKDKSEGKGKGGEQKFAEKEMLKDLTIVITHIKDEDPLQLIGVSNVNGSSQSPSLKRTRQNDSQFVTLSQIILSQLEELATSAGLGCKFIIATPGLSLYL